MKILFDYFSNKQICETAEQAIDFINGLKQHNQQNLRNIVVNEHTSRLLHNVFRAEKWQTNESGQPYFKTDNMLHYGRLEIATTGCGQTRIYGYCPLGETVEEHDAAVAAQRAAYDERVKAMKEARRRELEFVRRGWYRVTLGIRLYVHNRKGNDYIADVTFSGEIIANSGMNAYDKTVEYIRNNPAELSHHGNMAILQSLSDPDSNDYTFFFLGVKTDDGYSVDKWEEWREKDEI